MEENATLGLVVRNLGAAWRAARLYPPSSPMPLEAAQTVCASIEEYLQAEPSLQLGVVRGGFILRGLDGVIAGPGVPELAEALVSHGVAEVHFVAPPEPPDVITLLTAANEFPHELNDTGGVQGALNRGGVETIRVIAIVLTKIEAPPEIPEEEAERFLRELAGDPERLAVWLRSLLTSDDEGLIEGLRLLADASGDVRLFGRSMAGAFLELDTVEKDRMLELAMELDAVADIGAEMIASLSTVELTAALRGGSYGENLSSLSYALTKLPAGDRGEELWIETRAALAAADTDQAQLAFLDRMVAVRRSASPEPPLSESHPELAAALRATVVPPEGMSALRQAVAAKCWLDGAGVDKLFALLDTAEDFVALDRVLTALSAAVPHMLEVGELDLAMGIVEGIGDRATTVDQPWPGIEGAFSRATEAACGERSMSALVGISGIDSRATECAKDLVTSCGEYAARDLASVSLSSEADNAMAFAVDVLGRRLPELLAPEAQTAEAGHAAALAELFASDGGPRCSQAIGHLIARPEDKVRSETAKGLGKAGGKSMLQFMPRLIRDASKEVALVAVRAAVRNAGEGTIEMLASRLRELEGDEDLPVAREIIDAFAASPSPVAGAALEELAGRGGLLKRGKLVEMKRLAKEAIGARKAKGWA